MTYTPYDVRFSGQIIRTTVTDMAAGVDVWVNHICSRSTLGPRIVGLDCEWKPHPVSYMSNKTATLQLCTQNQCLIVQLFYLDHIPESLKSFLLDPSFTFVGVGVGQDVDKLLDEYGLKVTNAVDIEPLGIPHMGWIWHGRRPGLKRFASVLCGLEMEKPMVVTKSNWEARVLTEGQVEYGCIDAYASYRLGCKLLNAS